ncbi:hypothetical protein BDL97_02G160700 [Sphagnum fallax]|nr:hypothetical protein BDL97_02G160700 [Sphagnum fallax]
MSSVARKRKRASGVSSATNSSRKKPFLTRPLTKKKAKAKGSQKDEQETLGGRAAEKSGVQWCANKDQAKWLTASFHSALGTALSPLELDPITEDSVVQLTEDCDHSVDKLGTHMKPVFGPTWREALCEEARVGDPGSPVILVLCSSAIRCVELLRGMKMFTSKCKPAKLFAKHIKLEEQISLLEKHVNIAAGTPNRVRKLMDIGALGLGRLCLVVVDLHCDAKGLTVLSVPQVMRDFWELYRAHLHQRVVAKQVQFCLY